MASGMIEILQQEIINAVRERGVADNFNRKRIIVLMTFVIACASAGLTVISALKADVFWIYFCVFLAGTARTFLK